jgi:ABC-type dipeptide/oligopeptide/nickel transport system permease component
MVEMRVYVARRVCGLIAVLFVVVLLTFAANHLTPGDPVLMMLGDQSGDEAQMARLRHDYGLDRPLLQQFLAYFAGLLQGDFGMSYRFVGTKVGDVIADGLRVSPILALAALAIATPVGIAAGTFAARRRNSWKDSTTILALLIGISVPNFALAALLVFLLSVQLRLLPVAAWGSLSEAVLPVLIMALYPAAYIARLCRTYMLEVLQQDYIRTARAKGLSERVVIYRHALRNTLVPLLTTIGIIFGGLISNTFVVETIFNIPGLGRLAIQSIFARDYPVTLGIVLLFTLFYCLINLAVDLLYGVIDPRIRLADAAARTR